MTREEFLTLPPKWPCVPVDTPDKGRCFARMLTLEECDRVDKLENKESALAAAFLFCLHLSDENGRRILQDDDAKTVTLTVPPRTIKLIITEGSALTRMGVMEDVEKNSPGSQTSNSDTP